jgi:hypothetical protein
MCVQMQCRFVDVPSSSSANPRGARVQGARKPQLEEDGKNLVPNLSDSLLEGLKAMGGQGLNKSSD